MNVSATNSAARWLTYSPALVRAAVGARGPPRPQAASRSKGHVRSRPQDSLPSRDGGHHRDCSLHLSLSCGAAEAGERSVDRRPRSARAPVRAGALLFSRLLTLALLQDGATGTARGDAEKERGVHSRSSSECCQARRFCSVPLQTPGVSRTLTVVPHRALDNGTSLDTFVTEFAEQTLVALQVSFCGAANGWLLNSRRRLRPDECRHCRRTGRLSNSKSWARQLASGTVREQTATRTSYDTRASFGFNTFMVPAAKRRAGRAGRRAPLGSRTTSQTCQPPGAAQTPRPGPPPRPASGRAHTTWR